VSLLTPRPPRPPGSPPRLLVAVTDSQSFLLLRGQLAAARRAGFDVVALSAPGEIAARVSAEEGVEHVPVPMDRGFAVVGDLVALWHITAALRRHRPDVVDASTPKAGLLVALAGWATRVPARVHTLRGLRFETMDGASRRLLSFLTWVTCRLAHRVICISESLRSRAIECGVVDREHAVVLGAGSSNGLDEKSYALTAERAGAGSALRQRLGIPPSSCVIGFVGRIALDKGVGDLAAAWRVLREARPDVHWIVVGREDDTDPVPRDVLADMAADPRCHLVGQLDEVATAYAAIDLLVLPTYREGFGNVLIEAAAMERPTVATEVTGCVDAVEDGVTGTLVPPRDPTALTAAIDRYVADPDLRRRHGIAGAARARRLFGQQVLWNRMHDEYRRLLNGTAT